MTASAQHEIVIIGGGPVGGALALALAQSGRRSLLIDAGSAAADDDPRSLALSAGSRLILERIGVWPALVAATPIRTIHVSHRGAFGRAVLTAAEAGVPALGYVVSYAPLQRALAQALRAEPAVTLVDGAHATHVQAGPDWAEIELAAPRHSVQAKLAVIADGGAALVAPADVEIRDYRQSALIANVAASRPQDGTAFERFTPEGPLALLPRDHGYALIWTLEPEHAQQLIAASDQEFIQRLQHAFGNRAGTFVSASSRALFPLRLRVARRVAHARCVLVGNAAQTLHPVAGQGLNLGLRDAWELARLIHASDGDPGRPEIVDAYARARCGDRRSGVALTDTLVRVFSNDIAPLRWLRGCGLTFLDCLPPAKRAFMRRTMFGRSS